MSSSVVCAAAIAPGQSGSPTWDAEETRRACSTARTGHGKPLLESWTAAASLPMHWCVARQGHPFQPIGQQPETKVAFLAGVTSGASTTLTWASSAAALILKATVSWDPKASGRCYQPVLLQPCFSTSS